jgi:hypothetical protein
MIFYGGVYLTEDPPLPDPQKCTSGRSVEANLIGEESWKEESDVELVLPTMEAQAVWMN